MVCKKRHPSSNPDIASAVIDGLALSRAAMTQYQVREKRQIRSLILPCSAASTTSSSGCGASRLDVLFFLKFFAGKPAV